MQTYSTIVVIDSLMKADEIDNTIDKIERSIKNNGGIIELLDRWGKKRLSYEINKRQYGYYIEIIFKASGNIVKIIEREYGLDENILRYLIIKLDKKNISHHLKQKEEIKKATDNKSDDVKTKNDANDKQLKDIEEDGVIKETSVSE